MRAPFSIQLTAVQMHFFICISNACCETLPLRVGKWVTAVSLDLYSHATAHAPWYEMSHTALRLVISVG